jgi:hypothetical protein
MIACVYPVTRGSRGSLGSHGCPGDVHTIHYHGSKESSVSGGSSMLQKFCDDYFCMLVRFGAVEGGPFGIYEQSVL